MVEKKKKPYEQKFGGAREKFFSGETEVTKKEFDQSRALKGFEQRTAGAGAPSEKIKSLAQTQSPVKQEIIKSPESFGLQTPGSEVAKPSSIDIQTTPAEQPDVVQEQQLTDKKGLDAVKEGIFGLEGVSAPTVPLVTTGAAAVAATPFLVGGKVLAGQKAVQAGNAVKNGGIISKITQNPVSWIVGAWLVTDKIGSIFDKLGRKDIIDEQQQSLNTLGQVATTIGGQATEASGDWKKGMSELNYIYDQILEFETLIQQGKIVRASIKYDGKIYDLSSDIEDQLRTIDEQRTIIRSFVLTQSFPEMSDLDIQNALRDLEKEGHVKPYDITEQRRNAAQQKAGFGEGTKELLK